MNILTCTDSRFIIPTGVMLTSICINNQGEMLHFYVIIDHSVTEKQKKSIKTEIDKYSNTTLTFYDINIDDIRNFLIVKRECFPVSIYYRLLLEKILPDDIEKILYFDGDIIVRGNLKELWQTDITNRAVGAIVNQSFSSDFYKRLGYPKGKGYFNSGVLLINLKYWRERKYSVQYLKYIISNPEKLLFPDQDVLNFVLQDEKIFLPERYNVQEIFYRVGRENVPCENSIEIEKAIYNPIVVHYTADKPWFIECKHPLKQLYYQYRSQTQWKNSFSMELSHILKTSFFRTQMKIIIREILCKNTKRKVYRKVIL